MQKIREGLTFEHTGELEELLQVYKSTFLKQGRIILESEIEELRKFITYFTQRSFGHILTIKNNKGQCLAASFIYEDYHKKWHVPIVGVGDTRYGGTLLYFSMLDFVRSLGGKSIDFNGANSPNRGYFKHSMGARSQLYFEISYNDYRGG